MKGSGRSSSQSNGSKGGKTTKGGGKQLEGISGKWRKKRRGRGVIISFLGGAVETGIIR